MTRPPDLLQGPILPTLARLALPNVLAMAAATAVGIGETLYVGQLGKTALAAMALVFPFAMLMQMMSAGAMGGGVSSAISRALGSGDLARARVLAFHAVCIGLVFGLVLAVAMWTAGPWLYAALGGRDAVLGEAVAYGAWVFAATPAIWLFNTLISVARGTGDMRLPSAAILATSVVQLAAGAVLGLGGLGLPRLGMPGVALGQSVAFWPGALAMGWLLLGGRARITLPWRGVRLQAALFLDILRVGALACLSPLTTVATILVLTRLVAGHGGDALAGYGIGVRLEFLLIPVAFGVGVASVPMVGMAMGAGDVARARAVAWRAAGLSALLLGAVGLLVSLAPQAWSGWFSRDAQVLAQADSYLRLAGPGFAFFGAGLTLYFASQGAGKVAAPVAAALLRFVLVLAGGWLVARWSLGPAAIHGLVGLAMVAYGAATVLGVRWVSWGPAAQRPVSLAAS